MDFSAFGLLSWVGCPSGYLPQYTVERGEGLSNPATTNTMAPADNAIWSMLNDGEIAIGCCPSYILRRN
ncbi:hypothetical protein V8C34DRAFT_263618 [Trichoderma compactum]